MNLRTACAFAATTSAAACGFAPTGAAPSLADRLADRAYLDVSPTSAVGATAVARAQALPVAPAIIGGELVLRATADGYLLVEDLTLPLGDVTVPAGMFGAGPVQFTDLSLRLGTQLAVPLDASDDQAIAGTGRADLVLDWAFVDAAGDVVPLGMRRAPRTAFTLAVAADPTGVLHADLGASIPGTAVAVDGTAALRDVTLTVTATE